MEYRVEHDSMGEVRVPADKYWGAQTERSHNNFPIGVGIETMPAEIVHAFGILKKAAARANRALRPEKMTAEKLSAIEQADTGDPDAAANCFGRLMGELFVTDDLWDARLRPFGEALGRFIYLLDAVIDLPEDLRHGRYNPLRTLPQDADLHALLTMLLGECSTAFEALPVLQDVELLRNILYSGVWLRYEAAMKKRKIGRSAE